MRILVYSRIRLFGEGVAACLQAANNVEAVANCYLSEHFIDEVISFAPDVVLIDVADEAGLREGRAVAAACPDVTIVALALPEVAADVIACADAGFMSYVPRDASISQLQAIIDMAMRGEVACNAKISGGLLRELRARRRQSSEDPDGDPLTRRECEVLRLLGLGLSNKEIARRLIVSDATIKNHVHSILGKLRVRRRIEALARLRHEPWIAKIG
jgi:two-component system, NarL family, nitrate/nitrite response regulator NarL